MKRKTRTALLWVFVALALAAMGTALLMSALPNRPDQQSLWFVRADRAAGGGSLFVAEMRTIPTDVASLSYLTLNALLSGPTSPKLVSPFPAGTRVQAYRREGSTAHIDFSAAYGAADPFDLSLADYCLAATLTGVDDLQRFLVTVDGAPHPTTPNGFTLSDFVTDGSALIPTPRQAMLYFPRPGGSTLIPRQETLMLYAGGDVLTAALQVLLHGPADAPSLAIAPPETTILSVSENEEGIHVNLSRAFLDYGSAGKGQVRLILYAIVNTLTGLSSSDKVQFWIDGEIVSFFGDVPLDKPLARDTTLIFGMS